MEKGLSRFLALDWLEPEEVSYYRELGRRILQSGPNQLKVDDGTAILRLLESGGDWVRTMPVGDPESIGGVRIDSTFVSSICQALSEREWYERYYSADNCPVELVEKWRRILSGEAS